MKNEMPTKFGQALALLLASVMVLTVVVIPQPSVGSTIEPVPEATAHTFQSWDGMSPTGNLVDASDGYTVDGAQVRMYAYPRSNEIGNVGTTDIVGPTGTSGWAKTFMIHRLRFGRSMLWPPKKLGSTLPSYRLKGLRRNSNEPVLRNRQFCYTRWPL